MSLLPFPNPSDAFKQIAKDAVGKAVGRESNRPQNPPSTSPEVTSNREGVKPPQVPKAPSLGAFAGVVKRKSVSRQSHFYTCMYPPRTMEGLYSGKDLEEISLYIEQAALPELAIIVNPNFATGLGIEMPVDKSYSETMMTFVCDQEMRLKSFFDRWIASIMQSQNGVFSYYDDYTVAELPLVITDAALRPVYMVVFYNAYPKLVNDVYLASNARDYNRVQVKFSYSHWRSFQITQPEQATNVSNIVPGSIREFANKFGIDFNFDIPGIDQIGLGNILDVAFAKDKKAALKRQGKSILGEIAKPYRERIMEQIPGVLRPLGGSVVGQVTKGWL